jgi:hypothetical protein
LKFELLRHLPCQDRDDPCAVEEERDEGGARSVVATITCCCGKGPSVRNGSWLLSGPSSGRLLPKGSFRQSVIVVFSTRPSHSHILRCHSGAKFGCIEAAVMHTRLPFAWFAKHSPAVSVNSGNPLPAAHLSSFLLNL